MLSQSRFNVRDKSRARVGSREHAEAAAYFLHFFSFSSSASIALPLPPLLIWIVALLLKCWDSDSIHRIRNYRVLWPKTWLFSPAKKLTCIPQRAKRLNCGVVREIFGTRRGRVGILVPVVHISKRDIGERNRVGDWRPATATTASAAPASNGARLLGRAPEGLGTSRTAPQEFAS